MILILLKEVFQFILILWYLTIKLINKNEFQFWDKIFVFLDFIVLLNRFLVKEYLEILKVKITL